MRGLPMCPNCGHPMHMETNGLQTSTHLFHAVRYALTDQPHPGISVIDPCLNEAPRPLRIYVASSWRNPIQPEVVRELRAAGHDVYDFRHPAPGNDGFAWSEIDPAWLSWSAHEFRCALEHPIAAHGFANDRDALDSCDVVVCVLPCGRSAHLELGYAIGAGKPGFILTRDGEEPELMYLLGHVVLSIGELRTALSLTRPAPYHVPGSEM